MTQRYLIKYRIYIYILQSNILQSILEIRYFLIVVCNKIFLIDNILTDFSKLPIMYLDFYNSA